MTQGVYVLELNDGTRYVGSSHNIEERINQHKEGTGSTITKEKGVKGLLDLITKKKKKFNTMGEKRNYSTNGKTWI